MGFENAPLVERKSGRSSRLMLALAFAGVAALGYVSQSGSIGTSTPDSTFGDGMEAETGITLANMMGGATPSLVDTSKMVSISTDKNMVGAGAYRTGDGDSAGASLGAANDTALRNQSVAAGEATTAVMAEAYSKMTNSSVEEAPAAISSLMADPEIAEALKNPKFAAAYAEVQTNPMAVMKYLQDPVRTHFQLAPPPSPRCISRSTGER